MHVILKSLLTGNSYKSERNNEILSSREVEIKSKMSHLDRGLKRKARITKEYTVLVQEAVTTKDLYINLSGSLASHPDGNKRLIPAGTKVKFVREIDGRVEIGQKRLFSFYFEYKHGNSNIQKFCFPLYREEFEWIGTREMKLCLHD